MHVEFVHQMPSVTPGRSVAEALIFNAYFVEEAEFERLRHAGLKLEFLQSRPVETARVFGNYKI